MVGHCFPIAIKEFYIFITGFDEEKDFVSYCAVDLSYYDIWKDDPVWREPSVVFGELSTTYLVVHIENEAIDPGYDTEEGIQ
jgi:hypothetical protein